MMTRYRKWGRVIRYENGTMVHVEEAGEAEEINGVFNARPMPQGEARKSAAAPLEMSSLALRVSEESFVARTLSVQSFVDETLQAVQDCTVERLIVSAGVSRHETTGVTWTEEPLRVHLSLIKGRLRVLVDLATFDRHAVASAAGALVRAGEAREAPERVRLAPNVAAALLPALIGELAIEQHGGGFDGNGQAIETRAVTDNPPPNWYRPSYAVRPRRAWLNLRPLPFGTVDRSAPQAVALLRPVTGSTLHVLCIGADGVFPAELDIRRIAAVSAGEPVWYPYAAGSFGTEMML